MRVDPLALPKIPADTLSPTRAAIAAETILGGGLAHYTTDLDRALRSFANQNQVVIGAKFSSPTSQPAPRLLHNLRKIQLARRAVQTMRRIFPKDPWINAATWANQWKEASRDIIIVLPHVVINDGGKLDSYYAAIADRPFVWVIHDLHAFHFPDQWQESDVQLMRERFKFLAKRASRVIVHNEFTAADVSERLGIDRDRISIVLLPSFFSEEAWDSSNELDQKRLAENGITKPYALWASSSTYSHKNHERLLQAWKLLVDRGCPVQLVCTGSKGPRWNQVQSCIQELNLDGHVRFTDTIGDAALATVLRNAHLAICPTLFEGGGPGPAAEAMMAGVPLTASDIPQCRQLFNMRTDLCTFFDPLDPEAIASAVEEIVLDYDTAKERANFARSTYAQMRTWEGAAQQYWHAIAAARQNCSSEL
jgi:glycosyltransferase involved in cell wall biosynthesis